jgi:hypothetical protein
MDFSLARRCYEEMMQDRRWPDRLSDWVLPPVADAGPVRVFDTAEAALAFLAAIAPAPEDTPAPAGKRLQRRLMPTAAGRAESPSARVRSPQDH